MTNATDRDLAEWDAEIEAAFQHTVGAAKRAGQRPGGGRLVAFLWPFWVDFRGRPEGGPPLVGAMLISRRTHVCRSQTVTLPAGELAEHGITRRRKNE